MWTVINRNILKNHSVCAVFLDVFDNYLTVACRRNELRHVSTYNSEDEE